MKEIYWIERLNSIHVVLIFVVIFAVVWFLIVVINRFLIYYDEEDRIDEKVYKSQRIAGIIIVLCTLILTFLPNSKEMYRIIGIGGTIEYLQRNEAAKQLPDKCIKALDLFLNKITEEDNASKSKQYENN